MIDLVLLGLIPQSNESPFLYKNILNNNFKDFTITSSDFKNLELKKFNFTEFTTTQLANTTEITTVSKARLLLTQRPKPNRSSLEPMKIFVWELCCSDNSQENTVILRLKDHDTTVLVIHNKSSNKLVFRKYFAWKKKLVTFKKIPLKQSDRFITLIVNKTGLVSIYSDCSYKLYFNKISPISFNLKFEYDMFKNPKSRFYYNKNIRVYDDLEEVANQYDCPITTTSVLDGSILYFYENFNLNSSLNNLISFKHDSEFYSICYKNKKIEISSHISTSSIKIEINTSHNFKYGLYLYFI